MKRYLAFVLTVMVCFSLAGCKTINKNDFNKNVSTENQSNISGTEQSDMSETGISNEQPAGSNVLIAYFSVPEDVDTVDAVSSASIVVKDGEKLGNTEYVAQVIQQTIGGDLFRIETVQNYPLDHNALVNQASDEKSADFRPELAEHVKNFEKYEYVLLGAPVIIRTS